MLTLALPNNYVAIEEEEMVYIEGGWSWSTLGSSLKNLYYKYDFARKALVAGGLSMTVINKVAAGTATYLYGTIATTLGRVAAANWVVGAVIGVSASAAIYAMGTSVCFR